MPTKDGWLAHWLGLRHVLYHSFLFCLCSDIGEERGLFSDGHRRVVQQGKIIIMMVLLSTVLGFDI